MNKIFVCLFVVVSLLITPVAHAFGVDGDGCHSESAAQKEDTQKDGKQVNATHHCCCAPASFKTDAVAHVHLPTTAKQFTIIADDSMTSAVVDPLLEPPSHA